MGKKFGWGLRDIEDMLYKTQGIIIKKTNLGETDRLLTIYTKDFGKILVKAKSVRKNQAKLKGHLETFLHSHLMIAPGRGLDIITAAETITDFSYLRQNLLSLAVVYYFSELIDKLMAGPEKDPKIWQLVLISFEQLNHPNQDIRTIIVNFEKKILEFLGYGQERRNYFDFIQSLLNGKIQSRTFLQNLFYLIK